MATILLETAINAPVSRVFDLSRSIDLHLQSMAHSNETAIAGRTSGLIEWNETVTWKAKHFGVYHQLTVRITALEKYSHFTDIMEKGIFASMEHIHSFRTQGDATIMNCRFEFKAPCGPLGRLAETLFLKQYMRNLLLERNRVIKRIAESDEWKNLLN
ncbi:MAG: uncharacterized protein K0R51_1040 [Cytophagaceae bacterium]|jgi:ligand-binding SRPBCC domain-containing protein|nr:uncharacterized protein [Cytophagaceae bacterium]